MSDIDIRALALALLEDMNNEEDDDNERKD